MKKITTLLFAIAIFFGIQQVALAYYTPEYWVARGYSCVRIGSAGWLDRFRCTRTVNTTVTTYNATQEDYRTLTGYRTQTPSTNTYTQTAYRVPESDEDPNGAGGEGGNGCPFIYLYNKPEGEISVSLDSQLERYYPKPDFNQTDGWVLNGGDMRFTEDDSLFYELAVTNVTLNRNGKNFSSKEDLVTYLNESELFATLNFSDTEKENALGYLLPKIEEVETTNYYYLTVLSDEAVSEISQLSVTPAPEHVLRQYVAVYPTIVPVKTNGDFVIPQSNTDFGDAYVLKETGEFLISNDMYVSFE